MSNFKWFASLRSCSSHGFGAAAETHCPGNVASLPFRLVNRYQMIRAVSVNGSGPYDFLLDTGMQVTTVDLSLATDFTWRLTARP